MSGVIAKIYDLDSNELADISGIALEKAFARRLNMARGMTIQAPAAHSLLTSIVADDGLPNLTDGGNRKLICWDEGEDDPFFGGRIFNVERDGDGLENLVTIAAFNTYMELGFEADDRAGRYVRDATGNFINPEFGAPISGADLILQAFTNSQGTGTESDPNPGEGPLPIDCVSGTFDLSIPPAIDLSVLDITDWPMALGDFVNLLTDTNVVDVDLVPVNPGDGLNLDSDPDPFIIDVLHARNKQGTDKSSTVHFDYWTGSKNAAKAKITSDFATVCNKLYDYLGPRLNQQHWRGNITPGSPGTLVDPATSRSKYGEFMQIRAFDTLGVENTSRPLYIALWNAEMSLRQDPRRMAFISPVDGDHMLFVPPVSFDVGDLIGVNIGAALGLEIAAAQRVYGYDKKWTRENVVQITNLITSADAE